MTTRTDRANETVSTVDEISSHSRQYPKRGTPTGLKVQVHIPIHDPSEDNKERRDEQCNLDAGANSNSHSLAKTVVLANTLQSQSCKTRTYQIHLVLDSNNNSSDMLSRITDNGNEDQTNKVAADVRTLNKGINAVDKIVGADGDQDRGEDEHDTSRPWAHVLLAVLLVVLVVLVLIRVAVVVVLHVRAVLGGIIGVALAAEEVVVRLELEEEVHDVKNKQDNGGTTGKGEDRALGGLFVVGRVDDHEEL